MENLVSAYNARQILERWMKKSKENGWHDSMSHVIRLVRQDEFNLRRGYEHASEDEIKKKLAKDCQIKQLRTS